MKIFIMYLVLLLFEMSMMKADAGHCSANEQRRRPPYTLTLQLCQNTNLIGQLASLNIRNKLTDVIVITGREVGIVNGMSTFHYDIPCEDWVEDYRYMEGQHAKYDICTPTDCDISIYIVNKRNLRIQKLLCWRGVFLIRKDTNNLYFVSLGSDVFSTKQTLTPACKAGYVKKLLHSADINPNCDTMCPIGTYGFMCSKNCSLCYSNTCNHITGYCPEHDLPRCSNEHHNFGQRCDQQCQVGRFGLIEMISIHRHGIIYKSCFHTCNCYNDRACTVRDGVCPDGLCAPGFKGEGHTCFYRCPDGKYGGFPGGDCPNDCGCRDNTPCYANGTCQKGFEMPCIQNYGPNCDKLCHCLDGENCDKISGKCQNGCDLRYSGIDCQRSCKEGHFLVNGVCVGTCHCKNHLHCNVSDGRCQNGCAKDFHGYNCQLGCHYGPTCANGKPCHCMGGKANCNFTTGSCSDGCSLRRFGRDCQNQCPRNRWGKNCEEKCLCKHPSQCKVTTGFCIGSGDDRCPAGMYGLRCEKDCTKAKHIPECTNEVCHCLQADQCNIQTKICEGKCTQRFVGGNGNICEEPCVEGKYLIQRKCIGDCKCKDIQLCNVSSGVCRYGGGGCKVGWIAPDCTKACQYGGEGCVKPCKCFMNKACDPETGHCPGGLCINRNYGHNCQHSCPLGRFFVHGLCSGVCHCKSNDSCRASNGECLKDGCELGWEGEYCQTRCKYGLPDEKCENICNCKGGYRCQRMSGKCPQGCATRFFGVGCVHTCRRGFYVNPSDGKCQKKCHCLKIDECTASSGVCVGGKCETGWKGIDCQESCTNNTYGRNCDQQCHCEGDRECNIWTGVCGIPCHNRWYGNRCHNTCDRGVFLADGEKCGGICHCANESKCSVMDGECVDSVCSRGWKGRLCDEKCPNGTYGQYCKNQCHCQENHHCHYETGVCDAGCHHLYRGKDCQDKCEFGKYIDENGNCTNDCLCTDNAFCRVIDGMCMHGGCKNDTEGQTCIEACPPRTYRLSSDACQYVCHCRDNHICDSNTGECPSGCADRFYGISCNRLCPDGTFLNEIGQCTEICRCLDNFKCRVTDGFCGGSTCAAGYEGQRCQDECRGNFYGLGCMKKCHCENKTNCNHTTGKCPGSCDKRHYGKYCSRTCTPYNRYLVDGKCNGICKCAKLSECDIRNGECGESGCQSGRKGIRCQFSCRKRYGKDCKYRCHCYEDEQCDIETGNCLKACDHRYTGDGCQETCPHGRYSPHENCTKICYCKENTGCDILDGTCPGYLCDSIRRAGLNCQMTCQRERYISNHTCTGVCRCSLAQNCHTINGSCGGSACRPGWLGEKCNGKCLHGKFGPACTRTCHCKPGTPCTHDYGQCIEGCVEGFDGTNCQLKKDYSRVTDEITSYVGIFMGIVLLSIILGFAAAFQRKRQREKENELIQNYLQSDQSKSGISLVGQSSKRMSVRPKFASIRRRESTRKGAHQSDDLRESDQETRSTVDDDEEEDTEAKTQSQTAETSKQTSTKHRQSKKRRSTVTRAEAGLEFKRRSTSKQRRSTTIRGEKTRVHDEQTMRKRRESKSPNRNVAEDLVQKDTVDKQHRQVPRESHVVEPEDMFYDSVQKDELQHTKPSLSKSQVSVEKEEHETAKRRAEELLRGSEAPDNDTKQHREASTATGKRKASKKGRSKSSVAEGESEVNKADRPHDVKKDESTDDEEVKDDGAD